jgi:hypothetical protein
MLDYDQKFHDEDRTSVSLLNKQLMSMRQSLHVYRTFWLILSKQICRSNGFSASDKEACWTGISISQDGR